MRRSNILLFDGEADQEREYSKLLEINNELKVKIISPMSKNNIWSIT